MTTDALPLWPTFGGGSIPTLDPNDTLTSVSAKVAKLRADAAKEKTGTNAKKAADQAELFSKLEKQGVKYNRLQGWHLTEGDGEPLEIILKNSSSINTGSSQEAIQVIKSLYKNDLDFTSSGQKLHDLAYKIVAGTAENKEVQAFQAALEQFVNSELNGNKGSLRASLKAMLGDLNDPGTAKRFLTLVEKVKDVSFIEKAALWKYVKEEAKLAQLAAKQSLLSGAHNAGLKGWLARIPMPDAVKNFLGLSGESATSSVLAAQNHALFNYSTDAAKKIAGEGLSWGLFKKNLSGALPLVGDVLKTDIGKFFGNLLKPVGMATAAVATPALLFLGGMDNPIGGAVRGFMDNFVAQGTGTNLQNRNFLGLAGNLGEYFGLTAATAAIGASGVGLWGASMLPFLGPWGAAAVAMGGIGFGVNALWGGFKNMAGKAFSPAESAQSPQSNPSFSMPQAPSLAGSGSPFQSIQEAQNFVKGIPGAEEAMKGLSGIKSA